MKVCLVSDNLVGYHKNWSGAELVCQYLASVLEKENKVFFITLKSEKKAVPGNIFPVPACTGKIWFFKSIIPIHLILRAIYAFFYLQKLKPDVIHLLRSNSLFIPVMLSARLLKIPLTFTVVDYFIICPKSNLLLKNKKICRRKEGWHCIGCVSIFRVLERLMIRSLIKDFKRIITFTRTSKLRLVSHGIPAEKIKVKYIYDFSRNSFLQNKEKASQLNNNILFVGSFHRHKGLDVLIQALPQIVSEVPKARLKIIGKGIEADRSRINELVKKLKMEKYIDFLGQKKNEETLEIISKSAVVVVPEQWLSDFGPIILVETMSLEKPVIASKVGASSEFIKNGFNGFLVERDKPEQFAEKIIELLRNEKLNREMGEKAKKSFQKLFNLNRKQEIIKLYGDIFKK